MRSAPGPSGATPPTAAWRRSGCGTIFVAGSTTARSALSAEQAQRLCIARAIAVEPDVLLMDEPCSTLDPIATLRIETLMRELAQRYTVLVVTHNMQQASRISDDTGFMLLGELVEMGPTADLFTRSARSAHRRLRHREVRIAMTERHHINAAFGAELRSLKATDPGHGPPGRRARRRGGAGADSNAIAALAARVIDADRAVNQMELAIDEQCIRILALRQPAASDLRFIAAALKMVTDLERIGDLAVNMAERVELLAGEVAAARPSRSCRRWRPPPGRCSSDVLDAFVTGDGAKAEAMIGADADIDARTARLIAEVAGGMEQRLSTVARGLATIFFAKHIERMADHATNIAEMVVYLVRGRDVRHAQVI